MKIGAQEIILIVLLIIAILFITRVIRIGRNTVSYDEDVRPEVMMGQYERKKQKIMDFFLKIGISLVALGIILVILGAAIFNWAVQSFMWSAIVIAIGALLIIIFRTRK